MQQRIAQALGVAHFDSPAEEVDRRVNFLVEYVRATQGVRGFVLGISGGQDSTLAGKLAALAVERLRGLGHDAEFIALRLPYGRQHDESDAQLALSFIGADRELSINIAAATDAMTQQIVSSSGEPVSDFNKGNIKARMRMIAQYAIAGDRSLLVIGTDHAAESVTGFFTKFGDGAADVLPLSGLTKGQGAELLRYLAAPERLWMKTPTADLLDEHPGQTDESSLGMSYAEIDAYLRGDHVDAGLAENLEHKYRISEHKRRLPVTVQDTWWQHCEATTTPAPDGKEGS